MIQKVIVSLCSLFLLISCNAQPTKTAETIAPAQFAQKIKSENDPQIIDVRTPEEFSGEHLADARNINWNGDRFEAEAAKLDKTKPVFVYCKIGGRSLQAANKLSEMGFEKVYDLQGGILKWNAEGFGEKSAQTVGMSRQEYDQLIASGQPVLIDFYAKWCEPCKKMAPYLDKMTEEYKGKVTIIRLDADAHKTLVSEMKIGALPALYLYKDKKVVWKHNGYIGEDELKKQL